MPGQKCTKNVKNAQKIAWSKMHKKLPGQIFSIAWYSSDYGGLTIFKLFFP